MGGSLLSSSTVGQREEEYGGKEGLIYTFSTNTAEDTHDALQRNVGNRDDFKLR